MPYRHNIGVDHAFVRRAGVLQRRWSHHNELGLSPSGIFGLGHLDFADHIEENRQLYPTFGLARIF